MFMLKLKLEQQIRCWWYITLKWSLIILYFMSMCGVCACCAVEVMVKVHVVDLKSETIAPPVSVRAYLNQTIMEFKQLIAQVDFVKHSPSIYPLLSLFTSL